MRPPASNVRAMLTPRSRKPISIPSWAPIGQGLERRRLFRPRGDGGATHRRLTGHRRATPSTRVGSTTDLPGSTFHGATARWVALG